MKLLSWNPRISRAREALPARADRARLRGATGAMRARRTIVSGLTTDLLRMFVFTWLLLTVPVVCHHETAVVVLGGLTASHTHHPAAGAMAHSHPTVRADPAGAFASAREPPPRHPTISRPVSGCRTQTAMN